MNKIMTQEDKELLIKDLSARLSYRIKVAFFNEDLTYHSEPKTLIGIECINNSNYSNLEDEDGNTTIVEFVKPYLFPLSNMTKEQKKEYDSIIYHNIELHCERYYDVIDVDCYEELHDFYHKNHLDYRNLIGKGLALDATGLNVY